MSQGSNPFKGMTMHNNNIVHGGSTLMDDEDNVDAIEMAPSETSSITEHDIKYRPGPPTPYSNTNSSTI